MKRMHFIKVTLPPQNDWMRGSCPSTHSKILWWYSLIAQVSLEWKSSCWLHRLIMICLLCSKKAKIMQSRKRLPRPPNTTFVSWSCREGGVVLAGYATLVKEKELPHSRMIYSPLMQICGFIIYLPGLQSWEWRVGGTACYKDSISYFLQPVLFRTYMPSEAGSGPEGLRRSIGSATCWVWSCSNWRIR